VASEQQQTHQQGTQQQEDQPLTEKPEVQEKHKEAAKEIAKEYDENRPTAPLPGSDNTVAGTAIADWLDDDGKPKYGDQSKDEGEARHDG
jgi:hypothetical protein